MSLVVGVGLRPGTPYAELLDLVSRFVGGEVAMVATLDARGSEPAVRQLAAEYGAEVRTFGKQELLRQHVPTPSEHVERLAGVPSVAEAAVLATGARLVVAKQRTANTTIAVGQFRTAFDGRKIEAILDAPLNIAVTCDPGRGGRHVLGRHAEPRSIVDAAVEAAQSAGHGGGERILARDLAVQGTGHLDVRLTDNSELTTALATGLGTGASACGLTHSLA